MLSTDSWDALARAHIELALQYAACAAKQRAVVRAYEQEQR